MHRLLQCSTASALLLAGCAAGPGDSADPFAGGTTSVPFQQECVAKDAEGGCLKYTCKADQASDCAGFARSAGSRASVATHGAERRAGCA